jgi:hypothetical protein
MGLMTVLARTGEFTREDLDAMPDDGHRHELLDGSIVMTPSPGYRLLVSLTAWPVSDEARSRRPGLSLSFRLLTSVWLSFGLRIPGRRQSGRGSRGVCPSSK